MSVERTDFEQILARIREKHAAALADPQTQRDREQTRRSERRRQERAEAEALSKLMDARGIPQHRELRELCLGGLVEEAHEVPAMRAVASAEEWASTRYKPAPFVLVISGAPGCGKSCALGRWVARSEESAAFVRSAVIASTPRNEWSENRVAWDRWASVDRLAVDELGLEETRAAGARINALLCERFDNGRATIVATNLDETAVLDAIFDARLFSRVLGEQGRGGEGGGLPFFVSLPVKDLRCPGALDGDGRQGAK